MADCSRPFADGSDRLVRPMGTYEPVRNHDTNAQSRRGQWSVRFVRRAAGIDPSLRATKTPVEGSERLRSHDVAAVSLPPDGHPLTRAARWGRAWGRAGVTGRCFRTARPPRPAWSAR